VQHLGGPLGVLAQYSGAIEGAAGEKVGFHHGIPEGK
jgi:hypothetical protein